MARRQGQAKIRGGLPFDGSLTSSMMAAHELKTPLATIRQLSLELEQYGDKADVRKLAKQIQLTTERSLRLTQDLTQTSKLQAELFPLEPLNARFVLHSVIDEIQPLYEAHNRRLELRMPRQLPIVISHFELLRRVLLNFADNALYYADEKGKVTLEGTVMKREEMVRFGVVDGGPRIQRQRSDDRYGRPASSGLGLQIAGSFAQAIGAETGVTHRRSGSLYYIDVPISKQLSLV